MLAQRNKNAIIAILFTEIALLAVFGSIVIPNTEVGYGDGPLLLFFVLPAIGFLYINHYKRPFFLNVVGNWIVILIFTVQMTFLFFNLFLGFKYSEVSFNPIMNDGYLVSSLPNAMMITLVYANLKGFLKLQDLLIIIVIGSIGYSANSIICFAVLQIVDFGGGYSVYMFGSVFYLFIRLIGLPVRIFSEHNRSIPITNNMAAAGIIISLAFFPHQAGGFIGLTNTFFCQIFAIIGYLMVRLNKTNTLRLQRVFELTIASGVLMSIGGTLFQNLVAPSVIGFTFGIVNSLIGEQSKKYIDDKLSKLPDPSKIVWLFGLPSILASIFASIAIGSYSISSTNTMGKKFPYPQILVKPLVFGGKQIAFLPITLCMAAGSGLLAGLILKFTSDNNQIEAGDLIWDEVEETVQNDNTDQPQPPTIVHQGYVPPPVVQYPSTGPAANNVRNSNPPRQQPQQQRFGDSFAQNPDIVEQLYQQV